MSLPQIDLDDRDFQSLVDEARRRIVQTCPAWDEHNVSDPGITLIELFAWMTDLLIYRVNRIPAKVKIALLELAGVSLAPAEPASTDLRFRLAAPASSRVDVEPGGAEVATVPQAPNGPIVFRITEAIAIPPLRLHALKLVRHGVARDVFVEDGGAQLPAGERVGLSSVTQPDDGIYLGFLEPLSSLVVRVVVEAACARGTGVAPEDPRWRWEVTRGEGAWAPAIVLADGTGGFNYASGAVELQLPRGAAPATVGDLRLHWLRCRLLERSDEDARGYTRPPLIERVSVEAVGALVRAEHSARIAAPQTLAEAQRADASPAEIIGYSDGTAGQVFRLRHLPALALAEDEGLEVIDPSSKEWVPWTLRDSFADSGPDDEHYCFDPVSGEVALGIAIRERDRWVQRGKLPPEGAALRMRYRCGGGALGNVDADTLTVLRRPLPGIASVTNPLPATGGVEPQSLSEALRSAPLQLRTRTRAVTAEDYVTLAQHASRRVARARCVASGQGEAIVFVLPTAADPAGLVSFAELTASDALLGVVAHRLDEARLLGTSLHVAPVALSGATVVAEVQAEGQVDAAELERRVAAALYRYINPYVGGRVGVETHGWEFGHPLVLEEARHAIRDVTGVDDVLSVRLYRTDLETGTPSPRPVDTIEIGPDELLASARHLVRVRGRA